jgi:hypothetical protein
MPNSSTPLGNGQVAGDLAQRRVRSSFFNHAGDEASLVQEHQPVESNVTPQVGVLDNRHPRRHVAPTVVQVIVGDGQPGQVYPWLDDLLAGARVEHRRWGWAGQCIRHALHQLGHRAPQRRRQVLPPGAHP